jgi:hypothetical protein
MSNMLIWIYSGGRGREFHETLQGGRNYKSLGISALYWLSYASSHCVNNVNEYLYRKETPLYGTLIQKNGVLLNPVALIRHLTEKAHKK